MKRCCVCYCVKDFSEFYKQPQNSDGYLGKCKECAKEYSRSFYKSNPDCLLKERGRREIRKLKIKVKKQPKRRQRNPEDILSSVKRYQANHPEKTRARNFTCNFIPTIKGNHFHHWSYNDEHFKDVIELSCKDHNQVHSFIIYDKEFKMYRKRHDNTLLDSRELHEAFIAEVLDVNFSAHTVQ